VDDQRVLSGRYEIGELLGRGGMAVVHAGRDVRLGRQVAIKMLRADLARDPAFQARFRREAQSAAGLNHPSIVAVYDTGEDVVPGVGGADEHIPYIVMEHVAGRTLREILHDTERATPPNGVGGDTTPAPLGVERAVQMTAGVLSALDYSHRAGIVHRDIKPANVMVTPTGAVKVMDFGIARAVADSSATMTATQAVIGTAQYLSPEQARGETVDARSDLYSTGCLLYELLTGRPPFVGDSPVSVAYQHVRETPQPPSTFNPAVGADLDRVVLHALAKDREDRYANAGAFRSDLLAALDGRPVRAPAATGAPTVAIPAAAAAGAGLAAAAAAGPATEVYTPGGGAAAAGPVGDFEDEQEEPRRGRTAGYVLLVLAVLAVIAGGIYLFTQVLDQPEDPVEVAVPNLVDLDRVAAKAELEALGLEYAEGEPQNSDTVAADLVMSQDPPVGDAVPPGSTVTVVLSLGVAEVEVPDLTNLTQAEARARLAEVGLSVGQVTPTDDPQIEKDRVISSDPAARALVPEGSEVAINVSSGMVQLPDLAGQTYLQARDALLALGLGAEAQPQEDGSVAPDTVLSQEPGPGAVPQRTKVVLVVATAPPPPTTPPTTEPPPTETEPPPTETEPPPSPAP
jgi:beta-lactam-binding protein with PASTA domain/tRNA A-37 threonylcarbamoyl transferase component Bud32